MRVDLALSYAQVGLLLGLPHVIGTFVEPFIMLLGDTKLRKRLVIGGGLAVTAGVMLVASTRSFPILLLAFIIGFPASGAFVTLSQATLMDLNPGRQPHMMARWTLAGSLGNLVGPLLVAGGLTLALGWRWNFMTLAIFAMVLILFARRIRFPNPSHVIDTTPKQTTGLPKTLLNNLWEAVRNPKLLRWIILLQLSDLLLDVLTGYIPLYFTDVVGTTTAQASLLLTVLTVASLVSDIVVIPLLERVHGRWVVRVSALISGIIYAAWLLAPWALAKILLLVLLRFTTLGWYAVLQGEAYASIPGRSGTVMALTSLGGLFAGGVAWLIGWIANQAGLPTALWLLLAGPLSLVVLVPRPTQSQITEVSKKVDV